MTSESVTEPRIGRPKRYLPEFAQQATKLCQLGATDMELADFFNVDTRTIYRWRNEHEDFCQAVIAGKEKADERVQRALFNRAVGYSYESEKVFQFQGVVIRAPTVEHVPPDPGAAMNWLKNRRPDDWRDKREHEVTGKDGEPLKIAVVTRQIVDPAVSQVTCGEETNHDSEA